MPLPDQLYVFLDNSFLFLQGYKHVQAVAKLPPTKHPYVDYLALRHFLQKQGELKRTVIVGSDLPGSMISKCQAAGFEVSTFPKYPDFKSGILREKGIDHKICWEIAKTIFTNKDPVPNPAEPEPKTGSWISSKMPPNQHKHWSNHQPP